MDKKHLCRSLAYLNINLQKITQFVATQILLIRSGNQGRNSIREAHVSSDTTLRALKNTRQCVGNNIIGPSVVLDTKFKSFQTQQLTAKPKYVFNPLEKPEYGQVIAVDFKLLMFEITSTLLTTK